MKNDSQSLTIPRLAFDIGVYKVRDKRLPETAPFILKYDAAEGMIVQELDHNIRDLLKLYYELGGYASTPLGEGDFGQRQGIEIFEALKECLDQCKKEIAQMSFLEIGCSYGYLLHLLKKAGAADVLGIEPGEEGVIGSQKYDIPFIQDFFPTNKLNRYFDCILSHAVLEHIENPRPFLQETYDKLNENGLVFIAVPDSEKKMQVGDASILSHQHLNYFTRNSLACIMQAAGFVEVEVISSNQRSILYGWGIKRTMKHPSGMARFEHGADQMVFTSFRTNLGKNIQAIQKLVEAYEGAQKTVGFYAPSGALGSFIRFGQQARIFNTDKVKQKKYLNGFASMIEPPENLIGCPVDILFVESIDYDREIRNELSIKGIDKHTSIISIKEIYEANSQRKYDVGF